MNKSNFQHAAIALTAQAVTWAILASFALIPPQYMAAVGALPGIFFYVGREFTQRETRIRFREPTWNVDSTLDLLSPTVAVIIVALLSAHFSGA